MSDFNQLSDENLEKLKFYYESGPVVRDVLDAIGKMRRYEIVIQKDENTLCITVPTLHQLADRSESEIKMVLKSIEHIGCGTYRESRRGFEARLQLDVDLSTEIQRLKDMTEIEIVTQPRVHDVRHLLKAPPVQQLRPTAQIATPAKLSTLSNHHFNLRPHLEIELTLPKDLTVHEAERLSLFIKSQVIT